MMNVVECDFICQIEMLVRVLIFYSVRLQVVQRAGVKFYHAALIVVNISRSNMIRCDRAVKLCYFKLRAHLDCS